ncbi:MAG: hypothetical protein J5449_09610 [Oscillospiraceae bacterium]|nr:hypothetical protein [Oscillospiraceae bacterium]
MTSAVLAAATVHEFAHIIALHSFGAPVEGLRLGGLGAELYAGVRRLSYSRELVCALAGPAANLALAPLVAHLALSLDIPWLYLFSGAHMLLGAFNMLPIPPLDGARALYLVSAYFTGPYIADRVCGAAGISCSTALCILGAYLAPRGGMLFLLVALGLFFGAARQFGIAIFRRSVYNTQHGQKIGKNPATRAEARKIRRRGVQRGYERPF